MCKYLFSSSKPNMFVEFFFVGYASSSFGFQWPFPEIQMFELIILNNPNFVHVIDLIVNCSIVK